VKQLVKSAIKKSFGTLGYELRRKTETPNHFEMEQGSLLVPGIWNHRLFKSLIPLRLEATHAPFLLLGKASSYTPGTGGSASYWELDWERLSGWKRWLVVSGAVHASFTDISILSEQAGWDTGADVPALRTAAITRAYVGAFLDKHLRNAPRPLLNGPSTRYPEVGFCSLSACE